MNNSELVLAIALDVSSAKNEDEQTVKLVYWVDMIKMLGAKEALVERAAQCIAHRACCGSEHDPLHGKLHGYCVVCGVPWPCEYVGPLPVVAAKVEPAPANPDPKDIRPSEPLPDPHVHAPTKRLHNKAWDDVCVCGATRAIRPGGESGWTSLAWVDPVAAVDESDPPPGWRISETRTGDWWGIGVHDPMERTYTFHTYEEAVAACWAAHRAQQPATVTAPEPTLEAQLAEAMKKREELWYAYRRSPGGSCASQRAKDAYRDALDRTHELTEEIAARDGKANDMNARHRDLDTANATIEALREDNDKLRGGLIIANTTNKRRGETIDKMGATIEALTVAVAVNRSADSITLTLPGEDDE